MSEWADFGSGDAVAVVDTRLRITRWNAAAEALTGVPATAAIGQHCWEVLRGQSEDHTKTCQPGCRLALRALQDGDVAGRPMLITTSFGARKVWISTVRTRADGRARILHLMCGYSPLRPAGDLGRLTGREREVLSLLADGLDASAIGRRLGISVTTVRTHIRHILATLGVRSQLAAVASARDQSLSWPSDGNTRF